MNLFVMKPQAAQLAKPPSADQAHRTPKQDMSYDGFYQTSGLWVLHLHDIQWDWFGYPCRACTGIPVYLLQMALSLMDNRLFYFCMYVLFFVETTMAWCACWLSHRLSLLKAYWAVAKAILRSISTDGNISECFERCVWGVFCSALRETCTASTWLVGRYSIKSSSDYHTKKSKKKCSKALPLKSMKGPGKLASWAVQFTGFFS